MTKQEIRSELSKFKRKFGLYKIDLFFKSEPWRVHPYKYCAHVDCYIHKDKSKFFNVSADSLESLLLKAKFLIGLGHKKGLLK